MMGGLRYHDRLSLSFFVDNGNGERFFGSLEKLNKFIKAEWVKQGNKNELYDIGSRVLVILDNASYHKRQDILHENKAIITEYTALFFTSLQSKLQFN